MAQACDENQRCVIPRSVISIQRRHTRAAVGKLVSPCCLSSVTMIQGSAKLSPKESENSSRFPRLMSGPRRWDPAFEARLLSHQDSPVAQYWMCHVLLV